MLRCESGRSERQRNGSETLGLKRIKDKEETLCFVADGSIISDFQDGSLESALDKLLQ